MTGFPVQQPVVAAQETAKGQTLQTGGVEGADEQAGEDSRELIVNFTGSTFHFTF